MTQNDHTRVEAIQISKPGGEAGEYDSSLGDDGTSGEEIDSNNLGDRTEGHSIHFEGKENGGKDQGTQRSMNRQISVGRGELRWFRRRSVH